MLVNPTLTTEEFKDIHNALCDLDRIAESLEDVLKPEKFVRLQKAKTAIREAMKRAYEEDNRLFKERSDLYNHAKAECKLQSIWSIYEVDDLYAEHPYAGANELVYKDHWGDRPVSVPLLGKRWIDLWIAADYLIKESGDEHHIFVERFRPLQENNTTLVLHTGS